MPVYEFFCKPCGVKFEVLRPLSRSDEAAVCPVGHATTDRILSLFTTMTKTAEGDSAPLTSAGGCACGGACACGGH